MSGETEWREGSSEVHRAGHTGWVRREARRTGEVSRGVFRFGAVRAFLQSDGMTQQLMMPERT